MDYLFEKMPIPEAEAFWHEDVLDMRVARTAPPSLLVQRSLIKKNCMRCYFAAQEMSMLRPEHLFASSFRDPIQRLQQASRLVAALRCVAVEKPFQVNRDVHTLATRLREVLKSKQVEAIAAVFDKSMLVGSNISMWSAG